MAPRPAAQPIPTRLAGAARKCSPPVTRKCRELGGAMAEYEGVQRGSLRLKASGEAPVAARRKKRKDKEKSKIRDQTVSSKKQEEEKKRGLDKRTPAQLAYEKMQEKRQMERILKKASKTHKQRVEDFNRHLDTLTEHYDIPKVSWTK